MITASISLHLAVLGNVPSVNGREYHQLLIFYVSHSKQGRAKWKLNILLYGSSWSTLIDQETCTSWYFQTSGIDGLFSLHIRSMWETICDLVSTYVVCERLSVSLFTKIWWHSPIWVSNFKINSPRQKFTCPDFPVTPPKKIKVKYYYLLVFMYYQF